MIALSAKGTPYVIVSSTKPAVSDKLVGGKGAQLLALASQELPVPAFFCVTTRALAELCAPFADDLRNELSLLVDLEGEASRESVRALADKARRAIAGAGLPSPARRAVETALTEHIATEDLVAVRSSAVGEDSATASFAGQMDTYLYVRREEVVERVLDCLASAFSERALTYRGARGLAEQPIDAAVVVQAMAPARASGVVFTANPTTGDPSEIVITAGLGLGEGIVGGAVEADTFFVAKESGEERGRQLAHKTRRVVHDLERGAGTRLDEVPAELRDEPAIGGEEIAELVALAKRIEAHAGAPQDIEWTIEPGGALRLLQARPITSLASGRVTVFDNANIVESYPGITLPLTFSYVRHAYAETFREAVRQFGVAEQLIEREQPLFENLVSLVDGRVYYNILQWYRLYELAGFKRATTAWEQSLGITDSVDRETPADALRGWRKLGVRAHIVANLFSRTSKVEGYLRELGAAQAELDTLDLPAMEGHRLIELLEDLMTRLLAPYAIAVVNDFYAQQLYDVVGRMIEAWTLGDPDQLRNALVAGDNHLDSVVPAQSLMKLADTARDDPTLAALFDAARDEATLWSELTRRDELAGFRRALVAHLERYGDRTLHELKLETPSLRDDPSYALRMLRTYIRHPRDLGGADTSAARADAERRVRKALRFRPHKRAAFFTLLRYARDAIRHRENLRLARTRGFGLIKRIFGALGEAFANQGLLETPRDIFYLTVDEVRGSVRGTAIDRDLRALVQLRQRAYDRYRELELPPRIVTRGTVSAAPRARTITRPTSLGESALRGLGCSPGVVRGEAAVVVEPQAQREVSGKILIAPMTDPGWVFLMVAAAGLVVEKGSMLSHTAIIGRELGVPTVVGVQDATHLIRDGDLVELDGSTGEVRILECAHEEPVPTQQAAT
jgi:rifampicin phosphotransferase